MEPVGWGVGVGRVFPGRKNFGPGGKRPEEDALCTVAASDSGQSLSHKCEALSDLLHKEKGIQ